METHYGSINILDIKVVFHPKSTISTGHGVLACPRLSHLSHPSEIDLMTSHLTPHPRYPSPKEAPCATTAGRQSYTSVITLRKGSRTKWSQALIRHVPRKNGSVFHFTEFKPSGSTSPTSFQQSPLPSSAFPAPHPSFTFVYPPLP